MFHVVEEGVPYSFFVQVCKHCGTRCNVSVSKLVQKMNMAPPPLRVFDNESFLVCYFSA